MSDSDDAEEHPAKISTTTASFVAARKRELTEAMAKREDRLEIEQLRERVNGLDRRVAVLELRARNANKTFMDA